MALVPPDYIIGDVNYGVEPERILLYGPEGSGKTQAWLTIADLALTAGSGETFYVADSDAGVKRSMMRDFAHLTNVQLTTIAEFRDYKTWSRGLKDTIKPGDWVVSDTASAGYEKAQDLFFEAKYGKSRDEVEFERMLDKAYNNKKGPLIEPEDWVMIRNLFLGWWVNDVVLGLSVKGGAHLFATAEPKQIFDHFENPTGKSKPDKSDWLSYGELGLRPDGHRSLPHKVHTVGLMKRSARSYWFTPTKDRQRPTEHMEVKNFAVDYLIQRAGWTIS